MALTTFTSGQVLTAAQMNAVQANDYNQTVSTKTASYTLVAADKGTRVVMNSASATTITVNTSLFSAGDTLFLQNISTGVCTVTAGTATVATAGSLAIPQNGSGILYFTSAGVSIYYPSAGASKIAQVVSATSATATTTTSTSYVTSGLSASITPSLASSKVLISVSGVFYNNAANAEIYATLFRGTVAGTNLATTANTGFATVFPAVIGNGSFTFLDSPSTTSAQTYTVGIRSAGGSATASWAHQSGTTVIILSEVLA